MKLTTFRRILRDRLSEGGLRGSYWAACAAMARDVRLLRPSNRTFSYHVLRDEVRFLINRVRPVEGETQERARAAAAWLVRAQTATPDDGMSVGYFPCDPRGTSGWRHSYPETTGYIIPTLLDFADRFGEAEAQARALRAAVWETEVQMPSGAVQAGPLCPPEKRAPAVFNTGMVLHGYTAAYRSSGDRRFLEAGRKAADFLLGDQTPDGHFKTHGPFVIQHAIKTYNCLCGWALYRFGEDVKEVRYCEAAVRAVEAAIRQQQPNGWFANNCLANPNAPLLHTICYTLQGILEVGILACRDDFVEASRRGTDPILARISRRGFIPGQFYADWEPAVFSSCLTGNAQLAVICYRLYEITGTANYRMAGDRLVNYLKALAVVDVADLGIHGAVPGSFPLLGNYMTAGYPNWATKYFLDALLLQDRLQRG